MQLVNWPTTCKAIKFCQTSETSQLNIYLDTNTTIKSHASQLWASESDSSTPY